MPRKMIHKFKYHNKNTYGVLYMKAYGIYQIYVKGIVTMSIQYNVCINTYKMINFDKYVTDILNDKVNFEGLQLPLYKSNADFEEYIKQHHLIETRRRKIHKYVY